MKNSPFVCCRDFRKRGLWSVLIAAGVGCFLPFLLGGTALAASKTETHSDGADLLFGGTGNGFGEFTNVRHMIFDTQGDLYVLEAGGPLRVSNKTTYTGTARVQKFDSEGHYLSQFPLGDDLPVDEKSWPTRMAVDAGGNVFVAFPGLGLIREYGPDGTKVRDYKMPGAGALAYDAAKKRVAAISLAPVLVGGQWVKTGGDQIALLDPNGGEPEVIPLPRQILDVQDLTVDKNGHFYVQRGKETGQIFVFDEKGQLLRSIGSGVFARREDGSDPRQSVAVDSQGNIYSPNWGANLMVVTKYTADGKQVFQRRPMLGEYEGWNGVLLAMAPDDRLWAASTHMFSPEDVNFPKYHFHPVIIRTTANFFDGTNHKVTHHSTTSLGFMATLKCALPFNIAQTLAPIPVEFVVAPAARQISAVDVVYHVYDYFKNEITKGTFKVPLQDGVEARAPFSFTPPAYGWYIIEADISSSGEKLAGISQQIGVTPAYANLAVKPEELGLDIPRAVFCGLPLIRLDPGNGSSEGIANLDTAIALCKKYGATYFVVPTGVKAQFTPEALRPLIEHLKGQVPYYELFNEPNFFFSPRDFADKANAVYKMIKEVDPQAQVLGPSTCGILLPWIDQFYQAGGGAACDIVAIHDYEGHESIIPQHWRWKVGALRALMEKYGQGKKDIWQTERAISSVRGGVLIGGAQAVRTALQRNLMETLGVSSHHNSHYYLTEHGYSSVPSYVWDSTGPHPAALALRTRETLTQGRPYAGTVDFGPTGDKMLLGLRYEGGDGTLVSVQNLGSADLPIDLGVKGGDTVEVIDSFGNVKSVAVTDGHVTLPIPQLPVYLHLKAGQEVSFPKLDFGRNIAPTARITYAGRSEGDVSLLQNGILETYQNGDPNGDTNGDKIWKGEVQVPGQPQYLELHWKEPRTFDSVVLFGTHADNGFCTLLDYDLQAWQGGAWKTVTQVRTPVPATDDVAGCGDVLGITWLEDNNFSASHFNPVTTDGLRIVALRTTYGFDPDEIAAKLTDQAIGGSPAPRLMLTEIEVYAQHKGPIQISSLTGDSTVTAPVDGAVITATISNNGSQPFAGSVHAKAPEGWTITPDQTPVSVAAGATGEEKFTVKSPADLPVGNALFDFEAQNASGTSLDANDFSFVVTAPFTFHQDPLPASANGTQSVTVGIANPTTDPLSGTIRLELSGPEKVDPIEQPFGPVDPRKSANLKFDLPVDLKKGPWTATYSVTANHVTSQLVVNLAQRQWSVIGPFENDFDKVFGPETDIAKDKVDLTQDYTDAFGGEQKWQTVSDDGAGRVNLEGRFSVGANATAYAAIWVNSPKARQALLPGALKQYGKIWVNGKLVVSRDQSRGIMGVNWGQDQALVDLKEGENLVLIKILADEHKDWEFLFDLLDPETHQPFGDLSFSPNPDSNE